MTKPPRVPPIAPEDWSPEAYEAYEVLNSSATKALGTSSNMSMTLANHPKLAKAYYALGRHLLLESTVSHRLREILTLRIGWRYKSGYEWYHHVRFGLRIGLTHEEIEAVKTGPEAAVWSPAERCVLQVTDQLCAGGAIEDAVWNELCTHLDRQQAMDLIYTIGHYVMTAWAISAFGVQIEPGFDSAEHPLE
jgi:4-carboxymuconolactone decarboxylase